MNTIKCFLLEKTAEVETVEREDGSSFTRSVWKRTDTGEKGILASFPPGAIWRAYWYEDVQELTGFDGKSYVCKTPGGDWLIDGRASNCGRPDDYGHKCWCRHGEAPNLTVDKIGDTCSAGAGSISQPGYHGFLKNGVLEEC